MSENNNTIYNYLVVADSSINTASTLSNTSINFGSNLLTTPLNTIIDNNGINTPLGNIGFGEVLIIRDATQAIALPIPNDGLTLKVVDNIEIANQENPIGSTKTNYGYNSITSSAGLLINGLTTFSEHASFYSTVTIESTTQINGSLTVEGQLITNTGLIDTGTTEMTTVYINESLTTSTLTVDSISVITPIIQTTNIITLDFGLYAIGQSWSLLMNGNINTFEFSGGVVGGIYKIWLTNDSTHHILFKANSIINTMGGNIHVGSNAVFLLEVYKYTSTLFRMKVTDFT
jgi:hypothetical protein